MDNDLFKVISSRHKYATSAKLSVSTPDYE